MMTIVLVSLAAAALLAACWGWRERAGKAAMARRLEETEAGNASDREFSRALFRHVDAYILLVGEDFVVEKTNYYDLRPEAGRAGAGVQRVGELLRCKNAADAGQCGAHEACRSCPVRQAIRKCFSERGNFSGLEVPMRLYLSGREDDFKDCVVSVSGAFLEQEGAGRVLLTVRDVTRQRRMREELEAARREAEAAGEQKTAFVANMSHEIRTPLNAIVGFAGLLDTASAEERESYVGIIRQNTDLLLQLVNDILDMSKIEAGTLEFIYGDVDVNQMMAGLTDVFRLKVEEAKSPVRIVFKPGRPECVIRTEKNRVSQVLSNFLANAFKYTSEGSITAGYRVRDGELYFYVTDTGTGIPRDKLGRVFERFAKLDVRRQGTGLGLSISRSIVQKLGGEIGVESETGKGSTFWFTLPMKQPAPSSAGGGTGPSADAPCGPSADARKTILVAEDMDDNFLLCRALLGKQYNLVRAVNGKEAVELFSRCRPVVVLMDLSMPVMDGFQAAEEIRRLEAGVPIVAVTAFAYEADRRKAMERGFDAFLPKPLNRAELFETLRRLGA